MKKSVVVLLILGLVASFAVAPAQAKKKKKPARTERVVEVPYTFGGMGVATPAITGGLCFTDETMPFGCKTIPVQAGEQYVKIEIKDAVPSTVAGFISQGDVDGDGISDGYGEFCGAHAEPVPLNDEFTPVGVSFYPGVCSDGSGVSFPTTGTIVATFSNMP